MSGSTCRSGRSSSTAPPALIEGTAAHTVEVDDIFRDGIYHPGAPTISAALALARDKSAAGADFLRAVVVGYEISTRIAAAMGRAHYRYWHNTGTIGCFGAAEGAAATAPGCSRCHASMPLTQATSVRLTGVGTPNSWPRRAT